MIGVNFADVMGRMGVYPTIPDPPFIPGIEFTGRVTEVAKGVRTIRRGDRVMGFSRQGAYAEEVCVPAGYVIRVPARMKDEEAAAFTVAYLSAYHGMRTLAHARPGEVMLLHAAAGGVGTAALQLARRWNVTTIATASTHEKLAIAREHGAAHTVISEPRKVATFVREVTQGRGVDVVMDSVGGSLFRSSWKLLAPMGRYVLFGFAAVTGRRTLGRWRLLKEVLSTPWVFPPSLPTRNVSLMGFNLYFLADQTKYFQEAAADLARMWREKAIRPVVGRVVPFEQIVDAHAWLQGRRSIGKVVVSINAGNR
jgi:NADPH:quinone reductase-like Zn-dependent oxidoreductase